MKMMGKATLLCALFLLYLISAVHGQENHTIPAPRRRGPDRWRFLARTPPMGWNPYNCFGNDLNETIFRGIADALVETGLAKLGYRYINLDDGWAASDRDSQGNLQARITKFPSGIKALADYAHSKGLKFGIYSDGGLKTCSESQPGSLGKEIEDALSFAKWGVDYLKYDNCLDGNVSTRIRYPAMRQALEKAGRPMVFSICEWGTTKPATWAKDIGHSWRTSTDIKDNWEVMLGRADDNNLWADYAGPGHWNDPDMLEVGNGNMTIEEYRAHFSLWAIMKAPLLIGSDIRNISRDHLAILSNPEVIKLNQDPLGVQAKKVDVSKDGLLEVWSGALSRARIVVLLFNRGEKLAQMTANWDDIGLMPGTPVKAMDLWLNRFAGHYKDQLIYTVPPHGCKLFVLEAVYF